MKEEEDRSMKKEARRRGERYEEGRKRLKGMME